MEGVILNILMMRGVIVLFQGVVLIVSMVLLIGWIIWMIVQSFNIETSHDVEEWETEWKSESDDGWEETYPGWKRARYQWEMASPERKLVYRFEVARSGW